MQAAWMQLSAIIWMWPRVVVSATFGHDSSLLLVNSFPSASSIFLPCKLHERQEFRLRGRKISQKEFIVEIIEETLKENV